MEGLSLFQSIGLRPEEARVYIALLESAESNSIRLIAAETNINRGLVYEALKSLVGLGLVSHRVNGRRKQYFAESPKKILELVQEKKRELDLTEVKAKLLIPKLLESSKHHVGEPLVRYYEEEEGLAAILHDVLSTVSKLPKKEFYTYSSRVLRDRLYSGFPNFTDQRIRLGIFVKVIKIGDGDGPAGMDECKWLKEPNAEHSTSYSIIYGNKVAMISASSDDTPYGVVVEDPGVAIMHKLVFEKLWSTL